LDAGTEYYLVNVTINHAKTTGASACAGCTQSVCLGVRSVELIQPPSLPHYRIIASGAQNLLTWQGLPAACAATPVRNATWGQVKALYR
jgi:hypothetical protein